MIVVVTPNWRGAARRWDGENWHHFRALETVTYFDRATLRHALDEAGLIDVELHCVTWTSDDLTIAAHSLVPIRRLVLARTSGAGRFESAVVRRLLRAYDRFGLGDVLVGFARVPGATDDSHPHTTAPGTS